MQDMHADLGPCGGRAFFRGEDCAPRLFSMEPLGEAKVKRPFVSACTPALHRQTPKLCWGFFLLLREANETRHRGRV